ncbi:hypothetical protein BFJ72_g3145 [Fusarium proliferatum]|uniref:Uncharacterized protein n=1 Tax=Gibberella intermedia TaxID=948311 RepID=A0A420TVN8_GIBIN|nr:hypothetical protein BFJ72_g3145 [Fusarium proliferatum]
MDDAQSRFISLEEGGAELRHVVSSPSLQISNRDGAQGASKALSADTHTNSKDVSTPVPSKLSLFYGRGDMRSYLSTPVPDLMRTHGSTISLPAGSGKEASFSGPDRVPNGPFHTTYSHTYSMRTLENAPLETVAIIGEREATLLWEL